MSEIEEWLEKRIEDKRREERWYDDQVRRARCRGELCAFMETLEAYRDMRERYLK